MSTPLHRMIAALLLLLSVTGCRPTAAPAAIPVPPGDDASHQLRTALAGTSGYGDWAALVEDVSIRDGIAEVATTVAPHRPGRVDGLCALIADVLQGRGNIQDVGGFVIRARDGSILIRRDAATEPC